MPALMQRHIVGTHVIINEISFMIAMKAAIVRENQLDMSIEIISRNEKILVKSKWVLSLVENSKHFKITVPFKFFTSRPRKIQQ